GEGQVGQRVFVGAIDPGVWGQGTELAERAGELGRTAFEEPAAAGRKKRIAAEHEARLDVHCDVGDMTGGVAGYVEDAKADSRGGDVDFIAFEYGVADVADRFAGWTENRHAGV